MSLPCFKSKGVTRYSITTKILKLRSKAIHTCDLEKVCNVLEIRIELIPIKNDGLSRIEHYGKGFGETCNLGLVKGHYFINGYAELISYCLEHCEEVNDIKDCNIICKKVNGKYMKGHDIFIKAFQMFKVLMCSVD